MRKIFSFGVLIAYTFATEQRSLMDDSRWYNNQSAYAPPVILSVSPTNGPLSTMTEIIIRGQNLGLRRSDIVDVGISTSSIGRGGAQSIAEDHDSLMGSLPDPVLSCVWSAQLISSTEIRCKLSGVHGGFTNARTARWDATGGFVYLQTATHNVAYNTSVYYTFQPDCHLFTHKSICSARNCHWCLYTTQCLPSPADCTENCATDSVYMSCSERTGIIVTSVFLFLLIIALAWFIQRQYWELQENITWRLLHNHPELRLSVASQDDDAHASVLSKNVSEDEGIDGDDRKSLLGHRKFRKDKTQISPNVTLNNANNSNNNTRRHRRQYERELDQKHTILKNPDTLSSFF